MGASLGPCRSCFSRISSLSLCSCLPSCSSFLQAKAERARLQALNTRLDKVRGVIDKISGSTKAITILSKTKYPAAEVARHSTFISLHSNQTSNVIHEVLLDPQLTADSAPLMKSNLLPEDEVRRERERRKRPYGERERMEGGVRGRERKEGTTIETLAYFSSLLSSQPTSLSLAALLHSFPPSPSPLSPSCLSASCLSASPPCRCSADPTRGQASLTQLPRSAGEQTTVQKAPASLVSSAQSLPLKGWECCLPTCLPFLACCSSTARRILTLATRQ